jgi:hypothetical protein
VVSDRVPLSEVQDSVSKVEAPAVVGSSPIDETIGEMRSMRNLSLMMGFDGDGFDGNFEKALAVYEWAKKGTDSDADALLRIKEAIKITGSQERGKTLLGKIHLWTTLQDNIVDLRKQQSVLEENVD